MNLIEKINKVSEEAKNQFKPDLKKYGKNFRAISESAVLETLNPLLSKYNIAYEVMITKTDLRVEKIRAGRDSSGNLIEKLIFIADAIVRLVLHNPEHESPDKLYHESLTFEGWGSGVDFGDKATGKAITAAVKYALFKGFRLQYSDDPDAEASEELETVIEEFKDLAKKAFIVEGTPKKKEEKKEEPVVTEAQLNYIKGLALACAITEEEFKTKYGYLPYDAKMPMRKAREIIEELKKIQDEKLPF